MTGAAADRALHATAEAEEEGLAASMRSTRTRPAATTVHVSAKTHMPVATRAKTGAQAATGRTTTRTPGVTAREETATATATTTVATVGTATIGDGEAETAGALATTAGGADAMAGLAAAAVDAIGDARRRRNRRCLTSSASPLPTSRPSPTSSSARVA